MRTDGKSVDVVAPVGGYVKGNFYYNAASGWAGIALDTVAEGYPVALEIERGHEIELATALTIVKGDVLFLKDDGTLDKTGSATKRPIMRVVEVATSTTAGQDLITGIFLPQTWAKF